MREKIHCRLCGKQFDRGERAVPAPIAGGVWQAGAGLAHPRCSRDYKCRKYYQAWMRARNHHEGVCHAN
jgi:hypothetical protein